MRRGDAAEACEANALPEGHEPPALAAVPAPPVAAIAAAEPAYVGDPHGSHDGAAAPPSEPRASA